MFRKKKISPKKNTMESAFVGQELHVNPPADVSLARMEGRLRRINQSLDSGKWLVESAKYKELETAKRRLEFRIADKKGEL